MSFFNNVWNDIKGLFTTAEQEVAAFFSSAIHSVLTNGSTVLVNAAVAAVQAAEAQGGSGSDKLKAATAAVVSTLESQGIPVVLSAINSAIEAAVANLQATSGASAASTVPATTAPAS